MSGLRSSLSSDRLFFITWRATQVEERAADFETAELCAISLLPNEGLWRVKMPFHTSRCLVTVLAACVASSGAMPENFRGVVRDPSGAGLPSASVLVQSWEWKDSAKHPRPFSKPPIPIQTDGEGRFSVNLPSGLYDVFVSHPVMDPVALKVKIAPTTQTNLGCDLQLSPLVPTADPLLVSPGGNILYKKPPSPFPRVLRGTQPPPPETPQPQPSSCVVRSP